MEATSFGSVGSVMVHTTNGRGANPEELADRALDKQLYVSKDAHPELRRQALEYRESIRKLLVFYLNEAVQADRRTIAHRLREAGQADLIPLLDG
jgi:hypothetical protein